MVDYHVQTSAFAVITFDSFGSWPILGRTAAVDTADNRIDNQSAVTVKNYTINVYNNVRTVTTTFRDRKNGVNGSVAISIGASTTGWFEDNTNTTSISVGDDTEIMQDSDGTNSGRVDINVSAVITTTDQRIFINTSRMSSTSMADSTTYYMRLSGSPGNLNTDENDVKTKVKAGGTFKNMQIDCSTSRGDTGTMRSRINGANGNSVISITGTGKLQDTTNTDTVAVDDDFNFSITSGTGAGTYRAWILGGQWENTDDSFPMVLGAQDPISKAFNVTEYIAFTSAGVGNTTELDSEIRFRTTEVLSNLSTRILTNTIATSASTIRNRKNQANGNQLLSISASSTGYFEDTSNTDHFADGDEGCVQVVTPNTSGALDFTYIQNVMSKSQQQIQEVFTYCNLTQASWYWALGAGARGSWGVSGQAQDTEWRGGSGVFSNLWAWISANTLGGNGTIRPQKNGANVNSVLSITAATTGHFEDTTNTDVYGVTANDDWRHLLTESQSGSWTVRYVGLVATNDVGTAPYVVKIIGANTITDASTTIYAGLGLYSTTESRVEIKATYPYSVIGLRAGVYTNARTVTTVKSRVDGADGNLSVSIPSSSTGFYDDVTNEDYVASGSESCLAVVTGTGTNIIRFNPLSMTIRADNGGVFNTTVPNLIRSFNVTDYIGLNQSSTTESIVELDNHTDQTVGDLIARVSANTIATSATTLTFRKNAADGNQSVSIPASTTGDYQDPVNTDSLVDTDQFCVKIVTPNTSGSITLDYVHYWTLFGFVIVYQFARPDGDQSVGSWTDEGGATTNLYQSIDELVASDSDYVRSEQNPATNSKYECTLSNVTDPGVSTGHIVRYRYRKNNANQTINMVVRLKQGATTIASQTHNGVSTTWTDGEFTLSGAEADNITDYTDLRLEFEADVP